MERRVLSERPVTYQEVMEIVGERVRGGDAISLQEYTWEYLRRVSPGLDAKRARELVERLVEAGLKEVVAVNVASICPKTPGELRAILSMDREISVYEVSERVEGIVREYCSEKD